jgi:hypothetical protein
MNSREQQIQDKFLKENLRKKYIRFLKSPMMFFFFFVSKKEKNTLHPCQNYRKLNAGTIRNSYLLLLISELLDKLQRAKWFMKLDI